MRLTFLGTGTSTGVPTLGCRCEVCHSTDPHDNRTRPSLLLEYTGRAVVIDTSPDFRHQALRQGLDRLDAVVFTHDHADHILGLDDVRSFYLRDRIPIPIYADERTMGSIRRVYKYIFDQDYPYGGLAKLDPHIIDGPFEIWGEKLIPLQVFHGNLPVLGFRFGGVFNRLQHHSGVDGGAARRARGVDSGRSPARAAPLSLDGGAVTELGGEAEAAVGLLHTHRTRASSRSHQRNTTCKRSPGLRWP